MKKYIPSFLVLVLFASMALTSCIGNPTRDEGKESTPSDNHLQLAGSIKVVPLAEALGEAFTAIYPDITIEVQGSSSREGVISAAEGSVDIGLASREIKENEYADYSYLVSHTIAFDSIAAVTNPGIHLESLSVEQVKDIFSGDISNFSQVGGPDAPITVISQQEGSLAWITFQDLVMESGDIDKVITDEALVQGSSEELFSTLTSTPNTIGYLPIHYLDESTQTVSIDGVDPSITNIHNGSYLVYRPMNLITYGPPEGVQKTFLDWVKSEEGQAIVSERYITILSHSE